ncbi:hypothetical protein [Halomonas sp. HG01]|uniref:hypothetical protein n=1 Tax=Halomonas sp. HG01 TaxID=1609967 RepID=UPI0006146F4C|nr:hypothetical protein [Halomonas sp. HG01]
MYSGSLCSMSRSPGATEVTNAYLIKLGEGRPRQIGENLVAAQGAGELVGKPDKPDGADGSFREG